MIRILPILFLAFSLGVKAQTSSYFQQGSHEVGLANLGLGYSSPGGLSFSANLRYQHFVLDRFAVGAFGFYNNFDDREWMGTGPVLSYILFTYEQWFARLDQQVTFAKFNGFKDDPASTYGTTGLSVNYLPQDSNFFIGAGYARSYALSSGRVIWPGSFTVFGGWLWK